MCALLIAKPLSELFNKSLCLGKFPSSWKKAYVTPIFKHKGANSDPTNYRPTILSKIMEKLVFAKLYEHIIENSLLTEKQSGYRPTHSTHIQPLYLTHQLYLALKQPQKFLRQFFLIFLNILTKFGIKD